MTSLLLLLDAAPEPSEMGPLGLILIAIVVVLMSAAAMVGFCVFLAMDARKRGSAPNRARDALIQLSSPNQP